jgi:lipopolysaccharide transport system permease protein
MIESKSNNSQEEIWTEVIMPRSSWLNFHLRELWEYRDLIAIFVRRDIVSIYKQTILGPIWFFVSPIFTAVIYTFVFNNIAHLSTDNIPAPLFYLGGTILWNLFQTAFLGTSSTFISNASIFGKVYFPRLVSPIALILSNLIKFSIQLLLFLVVWAYYIFEGLIHPNISILLFPVLILFISGLAFGFGLIVSSLTTKYRDLSYLINFGLSLLMYATPVIYPQSSIPDAYKSLLMCNPIAPIIETFRFAFTGAGQLEWNGLIYSLSATIFVVFAGLLLFSRVEKSFMDTV